MLQSQTTSYSTQTKQNFTPEPAEYNTRLNLQINNTILDMHTHLKILGLTLKAKFTYNKHIGNMAAKVYPKLQIMQNKALHIATVCTLDSNIQQFHDKTDTITKVLDTTHLFT